MSQVNSPLPSVLPVVLGYSRFATTTALCLNTLLPQAKDLGLTVLVADNGSPDGSATQLQQYAQASLYREHLNLRFHSENLGFGGGMNSAIAHGLTRSSYEWVLLINSDTMFPPNALNKWLAALSIASPEIGLVGPLTNNAGNAQRIAIETNLVDLGSDIESSFDEWSRAIGILIREPTNLLWRIQRADFFCVAIRSKVWSKLHGLDLIYGRGYYEDFDFSVRAANAGYSSALTEDSFVYHQGSAVFKTSPEQKQLLRKNKKLLLSRFPNLSIPHRRHDNLTLIQQQLDWIASNRDQTASDGTLSALQARLQLRWQEVQRDLPRSPLKRWLWQRRVNAIRSFFNEST